MTEPQPQMRIGDRERQAVEARLRDAHSDGVLTLTEYDERVAACFAARTQSELDVLTLDLPDPSAPVAVAVASEPAKKVVAKPSVRRPSSHRLFAIAGVALAIFAGVKVIGAQDGVAIFGSNVVKAGADDRVDVGMLFGSVRVEIPDDAYATTTGIVVFGSKNCAQACQTGPERKREIVVSGNGAFGSVQVVRPNETLSGRDRDDD